MAGWSEAAAGFFKVVLEFFGMKKTADDKAKSDEAKVEKNTGSLPDPTPPKQEEK